VRYQIFYITFYIHRRLGRSATRVRAKIPRLAYPSSSLLPILWFDVLSQRALLLAVLQRHVYAVSLSSCADGDRSDPKAVSDWQSAVKVSCCIIITHCAT